MSDYWTKYWQQGHLTSFGQDFTGNYTGNLQKVWVEFFNEMPDGASILDLGTGNGALIELATQSDKNFNLVGIDSAELTIATELQDMAGVSFQQKVNAEKLPFENKHFDAVISQFGIEYANLSKAIPEFVRVLKPNGHFQFVMHEVSSSIVKPNSKTLNAANALQTSNGPVMHVRKLVNALSKSGGRSPAAENCRKDLNEAIAIIANNNEAGLRGTNFPDFLKYIMSPSVDQGTKKKHIALFERELKGQIARLTDLVEAALSDKKYQLCIETFQNLHTSLEQDYLLTENNMKVARLFRGKKD